MTIARLERFFLDRGITPSQLDAEDAQRLLTMIHLTGGPDG